MIVKQVAAGAKTAGLLAYLYGPGVGEARGGTVHVNPRTVASWDGQPAVHSPTQLANGRRSVAGLARSLDAPVALVTKAPAKHVGHVVVANHPDDPVLTDAQWRQIAADVMRRAGLSKGPQDPDAVRWIAVRHDDTSIHIAYTKVRESGRPAGYVNYTRAWETMRHEWEERLGLTPTGKADGTARRPYGQAESARTKVAQQAGDTGARPDTAELRQLCRVIALEVPDVDTYFARLRTAGVTIREQLDPAGALTGYSVGLRVRPDGKPVTYSARRLDPALDPAALCVRWGAREDASKRPPSDNASALLPTRDDEFRVEADGLEDVLRHAAAVTGQREFFDAAESCGVAGRRANAALQRADRRKPIVATTAYESRAASSLLASFAKFGSASGQGAEVAELALAVAALFAERAAWHELLGDRASAAALSQARRRVLAAPPVSSDGVRNWAENAADHLARGTGSGPGRRSP